MAKTTNEQWRDILVRRQISLAKYERSLTADILDLLDKTEADLRATLYDRLARIEGKDVAGATTTSRVNVLVNAVRKIRDGAFGQASDMWDSSMQELANTEAAYLDQHLKEISPVQLDTVLPSSAQLAAIVGSQPMQGRILSEWAQGIADQDLQRISDAVRIGMAQGEAADDIVRRVVGTAELDGADGILAMTRNAIASVTQTAISTISNEARQQYFEANDDIFDTEQWVATLDDTTCVQCGDLDGEEFPIGEGEQPPAHFNCRCVRVAVISGSTLGNRPANAAYEEELDGLDQEERSARIEELVGPVPATTTYSEWLADQTEAFQDHTLGPTRAALFRDGDLTLDRFVNSRGDELTLEQLRQREPEAFRKAGL